LSSLALGHFLLPGQGAGIAAVRNQYQLPGGNRGKQLGDVVVRDPALGGLDRGIDRNPVAHVDLIEKIAVAGIEQQDAVFRLRASAAMSVQRVDDRRLACIP
jgi:hypothetical protein